MKDEGDYAGGVLLGLLLSILGLIIGLCGGSQTRKGAIFGFFLNCFLVGLFFLIFYLTANRDMIVYESPQIIIKNLLSII